jgi:serine/threonine protein kinase
LDVQADAVTGRSIVRILDMTHQPTQSLKERLLDFFSASTAEEKKHVLHLFDVILKCLTLNPRKRITVEDCLKHPFFADPSTSAEEKK